MAIAIRKFAWCWGDAFAAPDGLDAATHAVVVKLVVEELERRGAKVEVNDHITAFRYNHKRILGGSNERYAPRFSGNMPPELVADLDATFGDDCEIEVGPTGEVLRGAGRGSR